MVKERVIFPDRNPHHSAHRTLSKKYKYNIYFCEEFFDMIQKITFKFIVF